jgi:hypothetical protein
MIRVDILTTEAQHLEVVNGAVRIELGDTTVAFHGEPYDLWRLGQILTAGADQLLARDAVAA